MIRHILQLSIGVTFPCYRDDNSKNVTEFIVDERPYDIVREVLTSSFDLATKIIPDRSHLSITVLDIDVDQGYS